MPKKPVEEYTDLGPSYSGSSGSPETLEVASYKRIPSEGGTFYFRVPVDRKGYLVLRVMAGPGEGGSYVHSIKGKLGATINNLPMIAWIEGTQTFFTHGVMVDVGGLQYGTAIETPQWSEITFTVQASDSGLVSVLVSDWLDGDGVPRLHDEPGVQAVKSHRDVSSPVTAVLPSKTTRSDLNPAGMSPAWGLAGSELWGAGVVSSNITGPEVLNSKEWSSGESPPAPDYGTYVTAWRSEKSFDPPNLDMSSDGGVLVTDPSGNTATNPFRRRVPSGVINGGFGFGVEMRMGPFYGTGPDTSAWDQTLVTGKRFGPVWAFHADLFGPVLPETISTSVADEVYPSGAGYVQTVPGSAFNREVEFQTLDASPPYYWSSSGESAMSIFNRLEDVLGDASMDDATSQHGGAAYATNGDLYVAPVGPSSEAFNPDGSLTAAWTGAALGDIDLDSYFDGGTERIYIRIEPEWEDQATQFPGMPASASFFSSSSVEEFYLGKKGILVTWEWEPTTYELVPPVWDYLPPILNVGVMKIKISEDPDTWVRLDRRRP